MDGSQLRVLGDVRGQLVVGDHNVTVTGSHSTVTVVQPGELPRPVRRDQCELLPRRTARLIGRQRELNMVIDAVTGGEPVQVFGPPGIGKSALIRQTAHELAGFGDGVVFLDAAGRDLDDVVQDIFESCYDTVGYRPGVVALRRFMAGIRICLVVDDLDCPIDRLPQLLDALPAAGVLFTSAQRLLWGQGKAIELAGLSESDGTALLAKTLGRALRPDETAAAAALCQAVQGNPVRLVRAAAASDRGLPRSAEMTGLVTGILDRVDATGRDCLALLAITAPAPVSTDLLGALGAPPATADRLAVLGLVTATERGYRLAAGVDPAGHARLSDTRLVEVARLLTERLSGSDPGTVAEHGRLVAGLVDAVSRAGHPELGARLARAAAPAAACSLRWGAWRRILGRGYAAAQQAGDERAKAYFAHEEGVRRLLTGKRLAAAAAFAAAAALWHRLGDTGPAAEHAESQSQQPGDTQPPEFDMDHPDGPSAPTDPPPDTGGPPSDAEAGPGMESPPAPVPRPRRLPVSTGGIITAVLTTGFLAFAVPMVGGKLIGGGDEPVTLRMTVMTRMMQVAMPEDTEEGCRIDGQGTFCTGVLKVKPGDEQPVSVEPNGTLRSGVRILYYGCIGESPTESCRVKADGDKTICITTSSAEDSTARTACEKAAGSKAGGGEGPGDDGPPPEPPVNLTVVGASFKYQITVTVEGGETRLCTTEKTNRCEFTPPAGEVRLRADFNPAAEPLWYGCDGEQGSSTCRMDLRAPRTVCVAANDPLDPGGATGCTRFSQPR